MSNRGPAWPFSRFDDPHLGIVYNKHSGMIVYETNGAFLDQLPYYICDGVVRKLNCSDVTDQAMAK